MLPSRNRPKRREIRYVGLYRPPSPLGNEGAVNTQLKDVCSLIDGVAHATTKELPKPSRNPRRLMKKWSADETIWFDGLVEGDVTSPDGQIYPNGKRWFFRDDTVDPKKNTLTHLLFTKMI